MAPTRFPVCHEADDNGVCVVQTEAGSQAQGDIPASDDSDVKRYATLGARNAQRHEDAVASSWMTADPDGSSQGSRPPTVASTPSSVVLSQ